MADTLQFSLVSPERELYSGNVDQVDIPGTEGNLGVMPNHSPLMAAIRTGVITVTENGAETQFFVQGGFADVTPSGLTVLAEKAVAMDALNEADIEAEIAALEANLPNLTGDAALAAAQNLDGLKAVLSA
jgi:F-type H+-transporting ATPase subunit epsilon